ncbi:MAG TPA: serine hydrolase domain-containing protein [Candidatus Binatia bacterium]|jgi:CubicO group peptidase (beta-lactamase class C family)
MSTEIHGTCAPGFEPVRDALASAFERGEEIGASVAADVAGKNVLDLWAGHADAARTRPWQRDTIANVYSTTKGVVAVLAHRLVEQGRLDLDAPVASYWPEFAKAGKQAIPVRQLLSHRCGLPALRELQPRDSLYDWSAMTTALAAETPWWEPGTAHGYEAVTYGWLVGEVLRRITGKSVGALLRDELAGPLGLDFAIGLAEKDDGRCAEITPPSATGAPGEPNLMQLVMADPSSVTALAFCNPPTLMMPGTVNSRAWRGAEIPGANGHGTARSLARLYGAIASGGDAGSVHVLGPKAARAAATEQSFGPDVVLRLTTRFGLGFMLSQPGCEFGPNDGAFGHPGAGGSIAFADPTARVGFSYVMNRMGPYILIDPRAKALIDAFYRCL